MENYGTSTRAGKRHVRNEQSHGAAFRDGGKTLTVLHYIQTLKEMARMEAISEFAEGGNWTCTTPASTIQRSHPKQNDFHVSKS